MKTSVGGGIGVKPGDGVRGADRRPWGRQRAQGESAKLIAFRTVRR